MDVEVVLSRWPCHIHRSSSNCEMAIIKNNNNEPPTMYHIITISKTSLVAQKYNTKNEPDKFWEKLPNGKWLTALCYSSEARNYQVFCNVMKILVDLDINGLRYEKYNKPTDFIKSHLITDGEGNVALCNKHLLRQNRQTSSSSLKTSRSSLLPLPTLPPTTTTTTLLLTTSSGEEVKPKYSSPINLVRLLKALFPQYSAKQIANTTPDWALILLEKLTKSSSQSVNNNNR